MRKGRRNITYGKITKKATKDVTEEPEEISEEEEEEEKDEIEEPLTKPEKRGVKRRGVDLECKEELDSVVVNKQVVRGKPLAPAPSAISTVSLKRGKIDPSLPTVERIDDLEGLKMFPPMVTKEDGFNNYNLKLRNGTGPRFRIYGSPLCIGLKIFKDKGKYSSTLMLRLDSPKENMLVRQLLAFEKILRQNAKDTIPGLEKEYGEMRSPLNVGSDTAWLTLKFPAIGPVITCKIYDSRKKKKTTNEIPLTKPSLLAAEEPATFCMDGTFDVCKAYTSTGNTDFPASWGYWVEWKCGRVQSPTIDEEEEENVAPSFADYVPNAEDDESETQYVE